MNIRFPEPKIYRVNEINMEIFEQGEGFPLILAHGFPEHDWGSMVVWNMPLMHPKRVVGVVGMSVPFFPRNNFEPISALEQFLGPENYIVHFNRQPGVADAAFAGKPKRFFNNIFRQRQWVDQNVSPSSGAPAPVVSLMSILEMSDPPGEPLMSEEEMDVFVSAFVKGGFTGPINWYRNITRNWENSADPAQRIDVPCAMIYGDHDIVAKGGDVSNYIPNLEIITLDCGHWIQQEKPDEVNVFLLDWLKRNTPS